MSKARLISRYTLLGKTAGDGFPLQDVENDRRGGNHAREEGVGNVYTITPKAVQREA